MADLKLTIASNITKLRTESGMTQSELGAKLNYSDKSISKWERAESLPDANVLKQLGEIFGVSMDYLFGTQESEEAKETERTAAEENADCKTAENACETVIPEQKKAAYEERATGVTDAEPRFNLKAVEAIAVCGIATFALFLFILFWIISNAFFWIFFIAALPIQVLTLLVLNSVWNKGKGNIIIVGVFILSVFILTYISLLLFGVNAWPMFILLVPIGLILFLVTKIRKTPKK